MEIRTTRSADLPPLLVAFLTLAIAASSMEAIWYLNIAESLYFERIGTLMNTQFDLFVAILFYVVYSTGAVIFAVRPALQTRSWKTAVRAGALYGFFCFSAHNLTDLADMKGFSAQIAIIDMAWGTFMTATACCLSFLLARQMRKTRRAVLPVASAGA
jgi:uncharacterized membrane protein